MRANAALDEHLFFRAKIFFLGPILLKFRALFVCEPI